jgi:hypothetical protein
VVWIVEVTVVLEELVCTIITVLVDVRVEDGRGSVTITVVEVTVVGGPDSTEGVMTVVIVKVVVEGLRVDIGDGVTKTVAVPV